MTKKETLHIRINENVKNDAEATLSMLGMSISEAINMFLHQVSLVGGIPFDVKLPAPKRVIINSYEELCEKLSAGLHDIEQGKIRPVEKVYSDLETKYGLLNDK